MAVPMELAREYLECYNARDWERCRALIHPEFSYRGADGIVQRGPDVALQIMQMYANAFTDSEIVPERICPVGDDTAVIEFVGKGTHDGEFMGIKPTGRTVEVFVCTVLEFRDEKLWSEHEYIDGLAILSQLGVVPELATV